MKKLFSGYILIAVIIAQLGLLVPYRAQAFLGFGDIVFDPGLFAQIILEWAQQFVFTTLKRRLLDQLIDGVTGWIQGDGDPKFVTDWEGFITDAAKQGAADFTQEFTKEITGGSIDICSPFKFQLQLALQPVKKFSETAQCTLDKIVKNIDDFYDNFQNGGWIAYDAAFQPQNNFVGSLLLALEQQELRKSSKEAAALYEVTTGGGFFSSKKCRKDQNGREVCEATTPGKQVGDALSTAVGADFNFVINADQIGEYAGSIVNALINRVIKEGVGAVKGTSSRRATQIAIQQNQEVQTATFDISKQIAIRDIGKLLKAYSQTSNSLDNSLRTLPLYIADLNILSTLIDRGGSSFVCKLPSDDTLTVPQLIVELYGQLPPSIPEGLNFASSTRPDIILLQLQGQPTIDELTALQETVEDLQLEVDVSKLSQSQARIAWHQRSVASYQSDADDINSSIQTRFNTVRSMNVAITKNCKL